MLQRLTTSLALILWPLITLLMAIYFVAAVPFALYDYFFGVREAIMPGLDSKSKLATATILWLLIALSVSAIALPAFSEP
jgi:hypothetical protein